MKLFYNRPHASSLTAPYTHACKGLRLETIQRSELRPVTPLS